MNLFFFLCLIGFISAIDINYVLDSKLPKPEHRKTINDEFVATVWWDKPYKYWYPSHYKPPDGVVGKNQIIFVFLKLYVCEIKYILF
jgi:hypothetical protein